jgi:hypothetical protein
MRGVVASVLKLSEQERRDDRSAEAIAARGKRLNLRVPEFAK